MDLLASSVLVPLHMLAMKHARQLKLAGLSFRRFFSSSVTLTTVFSNPANILLNCARFKRVANLLQIGLAISLTR